MADRLVNVDGVELCLETFGNATDPPVLLISGLSASMDWWDVEFCERLATEGRFVVRYDHRDTGLSAVSPAATFDNPAPEPAWEDRAAAVDYLVESERPYAGSLGFDEARMRRIANVVTERSRNIAAGVRNHWLTEGPSEQFRLAEIQVPTLVLHGTADPFFPFAHGEALAAEIPGATLVPLEGMGHEVPPPELWDVVVPAIVQHTSSGS
jgi:pimeloyl-ACP methyl ester carboxylesterase